MLRIMVSDGPVERRWILQGRLVTPWVAELERSWKSSRCRRDLRRCVVDLSEVTLIDVQGEKLLKTGLGRAAGHGGVRAKKTHAPSNIRTAQPPS